MSFSELPPPPAVRPGQDEPVVRVRPPGPASRTWLTRLARTAAPMGPKADGGPKRGIVADVPPWTVVYATATGSNVLDVDGNRYVDLVAGFGALLLGHGHPRVLKALELQSSRLLMALGDVYPADARIALSERLAALHVDPHAKVILGQSGADAVTAALKTAQLATGRPGVVAFAGAYHGLSYAPLSACGFRESYREPFAAQLSPHVRFVPYPAEDLDASLEGVRSHLARGDVGAVLLEPILGRGGCIVPPEGFAAEVGRLCQEAGALLIADEIWTGLGRSGKLLAAGRDGHFPDIVCLGKGLGGGLPISACIGRGDVMAAWRQEHEVVHTTTFTGAPLPCTTALATLDVLSKERLPARAAEVGARWLATLHARLASTNVRARGAGFMIGIDVGRAGGGSRLMHRLLERGYLTSTGGTDRSVLVLTPPLNIAEDLLEGFTEALLDALEPS
ncbi:MAG: aspartate aminotransferase family protein [Polyangiaceae bacterium]|nr:aspartate aminotransferase family protein [Polyangiaceae bacterium]